MQVIEKLRTFKKGNTPSEWLKVISGFNNLGIRVNYEPPIGSGRILLYKVSTKNAISKECNGLIIDCKTEKVICVPPQSLRREEPGAYIKGLRNYKVFLAEDGTVVNLYYYNDKWVMGTARGIDMSNVEWCGIKYSDALTEALTEAKFDLSKLDNNYSYTVLLVHPKMHPSQSKPNIKFISSFNLTTNVRSWEPDPSLGLQGQTLIEPFDIKKEYTRCMTSVDQSFYGLIFRNIINGDSIVIESTFMKSLRKKLYDSRLVPDAYHDRYKYIKLLSVLDDQCDQLTAVVPSWSNDIKVISEKINTEVKAVYSAITAPTAPTTVITSNTKFWIDQISKFRSIDQIKTLEEIKSLIYSRVWVETWYQLID